MPLLDDRSTFCFSSYRDGEWRCFFNTYSVEMNEAMWKSIMEAIDNNADASGTLPGALFDLAQGMDDIVSQEDMAFECDLFAGMWFNNIYTLKVRAEGLAILAAAIQTGGRFGDERRVHTLEEKSLWAFYSTLNTLNLEYQARRERVENGTGAPKPAPHTRIRRRREGE